ncbi:hypothetical protein GCM10018771_18460 [Streptomyces cellulosae]|nr:hypothetical protein GCM10018771_18460 [Streptomyces cellulosae]
MPGEVAAARLDARTSGSSDADASVADAMRAAEPPWPGAVPVDTGGSLGAAVERALAAVRPWGTAQAPVFRRPYMEPD